MDFLADHEAISHWLIHYGSWSLMILLALGIIALPVPEETLLVVAGVMMRNGLLDVPQTFLAAYAGSMCGISVSYLLGRTLGVYFTHKYGYWFGITAARLAKAHEWFEHFGKWALLLGYFVPGVRHLTGLSAGMTYLEYNIFALFAYTGAIVWVTLFLSLGYFFGDYLLSIVENLEINIEGTLGVLLLIFLGYIIYRYHIKKPE